MLLRSHGGGNCSGDGGAHEGGPDLHPTALYRHGIAKQLSGLLWSFSENSHNS